MSYTIPGSGRIGHDGEKDAEFALRQCRNRFQKPGFFDFHLAEQPLVGCKILRPRSPPAREIKRIAQRQHESTLTHPYSEGSKKFDLDELSLYDNRIGENEMPLVTVVITLMVVGVLLWLVNRFIPMQGTIKGILNAVVVIVVVLWIMNVFGLYHYVSQFRVGPNN